MRNKTIWLMGGLGNVLFQLFAKEIIEAKYPGLKVNVSSQLLEKNWLTFIGKWSIHEKNYNKLCKKNTHVKKPLVIALIAFILKKYSLPSNNWISIYEKDKLLKNANNIFGYFQSKKLINSNLEEFNAFCTEIRKKLKKTKVLKTLVHYRLGDSNWAKKNRQYYDIIKNEIYNSEEIIFIITDSVEKAKLFFETDENKNIIIIENTTAFEDFSQLAHSEKLYCAPSTFSWWAAQISKEAKTTIMPKYLFGKLGHYNNSGTLKVI